MTDMFAQAIPASVPRSLLNIIAISLFLHIGGLVFVLLQSGPGPLVYGDGAGYLSLAENIRQGFGFVTETANGFEFEVFRTPGLPLLLSPFSGSFAGLISYFFLMAMLGAALLPYLIWKIGRSLFNERVALIAAGITALEPMLIFFSWFPLTEIPFLLFSLASIFILTKSLAKESYLLATLSGLCAGYAVLIRPGSLVLFGFAYLILGFYFLVRRSSVWSFFLVVLSLMFLVLAPWYARTHEVSGVWTLSGAGWRNVYTDYLPSIRALKNGTDWGYERNKIKDVDSVALGLSRFELNNPKNSAILRKASLSEIFDNLPTVFKLEPALLFSFFTNDGYYYTASRLGFIPRLPSHVSPTRLLLDRGFEAIPEILGQLKNQLFVPVLGRTVTLAIFSLALIGVFSRRYRIALLLGSVVALAALTSTVLGFGVEARLRIQIMPILFLLTALGVDVLLGWRASLKNYGKA